VATTNEEKSFREAVTVFNTGGIEREREREREREKCNLKQVPFFLPPYLHSSGRRKRIAPSCAKVQNKG
jgi:hypothetical protein